MNDLIEHLKASGDLGQRAVKLIEQLLADSNIQQTRIAELEKKNAQYAKMCVRNDEWLCARDQEIQRLGAALREQENSYAINKEYIKRIAELEAGLEDFKALKDRFDNGIKYDEELNVYTVRWTKRELENAQKAAAEIYEKIHWADKARTGE
jgi:hypothetical protein